MNQLLQKVTDATQAVSLKDVFGNLSSDAGLTDPKEKVGQVFQYVGKGVFPVKESATQIVKAIQPVELRRRVEYELSTISKWKGRNKRFTTIVYVPSRQV